MDSHALFQGKNNGKTVAENFKDKNLESSPPEQLGQVQLQFVAMAKGVGYRVLSFFKCLATPLYKGR